MIQLMKLAEALNLRADVQKRIASLKERLIRNAKVQEGDVPAEDPVMLLKELDENKQKFVAEYIYLLALSSFKKLTNEESEKFQKSCFALLKDYAK